MNKELLIVIIIIYLLFMLISMSISICNDKTNALSIEISTQKTLISDLGKQNKTLNAQISDLNIVISQLKEQISLFKTENKVINKSNLSINYLGTFKCYAYNKGCNGLKTSSGAICKEGRTVAVTPNIPEGTVLYIEDIGFRIAEDRIDQTGNSIDIFMSSEKDCLKWGSPNKEVWIVK